MDNIFELNRIHGGLQLILRYPNGYGASIVQHENSYGGENNGTEFEVATIKFEDDVNWSICYDVSDVQGFLTLAEVKEIANKIKNYTAEVITYKCFDCGNEWTAVGVFPVNVCGRCGGTTISNNNEEV